MYSRIILFMHFDNFSLGAVPQISGNVYFTNKIIQHGFSYEKRKMHEVLILTFCSIALLHKISNPYWTSSSKN